MSRIGKLPIALPDGVDVVIEPDHLVVTGPKGKLRFDLVGEVEISQDERNIIIAPRDREDAHSRAMWGTSRSRIANMVQGVSQGFEKTLELVGVGYRAQMRGNDVELSLGFSHPVIYSPPEGVSLAVPAQGEIRVSGIDIQKTGQAAAEIRRFRPPEPYKGKGVRYRGEHVRRKAGKKK